MGLTNARINWSVPAVTMNGNVVASNNRLPTAAQQRVLSQRAATTHFEIAVVERISGAGGNISAAQFQQWRDGTLPRNANGQLTAAAQAIEKRLNDLRDKGELFRPSVPSTVWTGNNAVDSRVTAWNYSTTIGGLTAGKTYMVFIFAVSDTRDVQSVVARQQIKMPGNANTERARLSPTLTILNRNNQTDQPRLGDNILKMSYRLANNIHAPLVNMAGTTVTLSIGIGAGQPVEHQFELKNEDGTIIGRSGDDFTLMVLKDELAFSNSPVGTGTLLLSGEGIRAGAGQVNVVLASITNLTGAETFNGTRNVRVTI